MNRLEDRLRDAFSAAAETVRPESVAGLAEPVQAVRARRLAPLAAAAAVAFVVVGASVAVPLALAGGHGPRPPSGGIGTSPAVTSGPSRATAITMPSVVGMSALQAETVLEGAGFEFDVTIFEQSTTDVPPGTVIDQTPVGGVRVAVGAAVRIGVAAGPGAPGIHTLPRIRTATFATYAVSFQVEQGWQRIARTGPQEGYRGVDGWVNVGAVAEPGGLRAACAAVASQHAYGSHPQIMYRSIDGRPGCVIVPSGDAPVASQPPEGPRLPATAALVEYRTPLSGGDNFLLIGTDPPHLQEIIDTLQLDH